jgi:hypothetical protein
LLSMMLMSHLKRFSINLASIHAVPNLEFEIGIAPRRVRNQHGLLIILIQYAEPPLNGHGRRHPTIILCHPASLAIAARLQVGTNKISNSASILKARNLMLPSSVQRCDVGVAASTSMDPRNRKFNDGAVLLCTAPNLVKKMASYQIRNGRILRRLTRRSLQLVVQSLYIHIVLCWFGPPAEKVASPLTRSAVLSCMRGRMRVAGQQPGT